MAMTMTQKILAAHAGLESVKAGQLIEANLDLVLGNDITSPVAVKEFEKFGVKDVFDKEYANNSFNRVYTTNLTYVSENIKNSIWYKDVDCSIFIGKIINQLSNNNSITPLLQGDPDIFKEVQKKLLKR